MRIKKLLFIVLIFFVIIGCVGYFNKDKIVQKQEEKYTKTRSARNSDLDNVDFVYASDNLSVSIRFVAKTNIDSLTVKVVLKGKDSFLLDSQIITVGNVQEGQQYIVTSVLPNNEITKGKVIKGCEFSVEAGTVAYSVAPGLYVN